MGAKSILISGAGIGGPTLAFWLKAAGFEPTLVEHAPRLREGGYIVDFWGLGYEIAEQMDLIGEINRVGYHMQELRFVDHQGRRTSGFGARVFRELTDGRFVTLVRSDLSRLLFERLEGQTEVLFGDTITALLEDADGVRVQFKQAAERRFDLVIGADGLHSNVRRLIFGRQDQFEKYLGYVVAAVEARGYRPRDENVYLMYGAPGRMLGRFALHDDRTLFLFVFTSDVNPAELPAGIAEQIAVLRTRFHRSEWECQSILDVAAHAPEVYFDRVSQIELDRWSRGRVALVGDAAFCVSLLGGQGSALAMTAAYVLAGELANARGDHREAFVRYEELLRPYIRMKQEAARRFASSFAPRTRWGLFLRDRVVNACAIPGLATLAFGREMTDKLILPNYRWSRPAM